MEKGTVSILNVGAGDVKISFERSNPAERIRAARIVKDMLRRGYALMIEVERDGVKAYERALDFNEDTCEYIIADFDPVTAAVADTDERLNKAVALRREENENDNGEASERVAPAAESNGPKRGRRGRRPIDATDVPVTAIGRSAGG